MDAGRTQCFLTVLLQLPEEYLSLLLPGAPPSCVSWWPPSPLGQLWAASTQVSVGAGCRLPFSIVGEGLLLPLRRTRSTVGKDEETRPIPTPTHILRGCWPPAKARRFHLAGLSVELGPINCLGVGWGEGLLTI